MRANDRHGRLEELGPGQVETEGTPEDRGHTESPRCHLEDSTGEPTELVSGEPSKLDSGHWSGLAQNLGGSLVIFFFWKLFVFEEGADGKQAENHRGSMDQGGPLADQHDMECTGTGALGCSGLRRTAGYPAVLDSTTSK